MLHNIRAVLLAQIQNHKILLIIYFTNYTTLHITNQFQ